MPLILRLMFYILFNERLATNPKLHSIIEYKYYQKVNGIYLNKRKYHILRPLNKKIPAENIPVLICDIISLCINYIIFLASSILENFFYRLYLFQVIHFIHLRFSFVYHTVIVRLVEDYRILPRIQRNLWISYWSLYLYSYLALYTETTKQLSQPNFWYPRPHR